MTDKIFGNIPDTESLNELANNLRKAKEFDEIHLLCKENGISEDVAQDYAQGKRLILAEAGYLENRQAAGRIQEGLLIAEQAAREEKQHGHTLEDVRKKLEAELQIYRDGDSKYVVEKLLELCATDNELLNAIMLPHKTYDKAFRYFYDRSRTVGYQMPHGGVVYLDNNKAVELSVEYFKKDDAAEEKKKAEQKAAQQIKQKLATAEKKADAKQESKGPEPKKLEKSHEPKANKKGLNGQLSLFDILGGAEG